MGEHDQTVLHDADADQEIDDGRLLRTYDDDDDYGDYDDLSTPLTVVYRGAKLIPDTVRVDSGPFSVTEWESLYSSVFTFGRSNFSVASFAPVVDDSWRVVGHLGWADGNDILVPEETVRNDRLFWSILRELRLGEWRQQEADRWDQMRPFPNSTFPRPTTFPPPAPKDGKRWRGPENCLPRPPTVTRWDPLKEEETDQYVRDLDGFVKGGGKAFVGRHFLKPGSASYLDLYPRPPDGEVGSPKKPYSSGYELLVLVDPDGNIKGVMDIRKIFTTQHDKDAEIFLGLLELTMTVAMIIDIVPIAVVLFRLGAKIATRATIWAIRLVVKQEAKAALEFALQRARRGLVGAMSGPERAEAKTVWGKLKEKFWDAGSRPPRQQFSKAKAMEWNKKIADRMTELGIPKKNQGAGIRHLPPPGKKPPPGGSKMKPIWDENGEAFNPTGGTRGGRFRSGPPPEPIYGGSEGGISVHGNVFDRWEGFDLWNDPTTLDADRIDAVIAHEWSEFNGLSHYETVEMVPQTKLAIRPRARELLREMAKWGNSEKAFTEFTKAEWNAIKAAGKESASFEEKQAVIAAWRRAQIIIP